MPWTRRVRYRQTCGKISLQVRKVLSLDKLKSFEIIYYTNESFDHRVRLETSRASFETQPENLHRKFRKISARNPLKRKLLFLTRKSWKYSFGDVERLFGNNAGMFWQKNGKLWSKCTKNIKLRFVNKDFLSECFFG